MSAWLGTYSIMMIRRYLLMRRRNRMVALLKFRQQLSQAKENRAARRWYVRPVNVHRNARGEFVLAQELRDDPEQHFQAFRLDGIAKKSIYLHSAFSSVGTRQQLCFRWAQNMKQIWYLITHLICHCSCHYLIL